MVQQFKEVGPQRYRETFGRYYEDFHVGDVYEHRPGKTVTEYDNHLFTLMTMNTHPMHFDAEFAKASEFKKNIVVSPYTLALLIGMSVTDCSEVLAKRDSQSRPGQGIVTIRTIGLNQDGVKICTFVRNMLIPGRGNAVEDRVGNY